MKITGFETIRLGEFPNLLWLLIHTDEGLVGLGETFFGPRAVEAHIHETAAPLLLGKPALQMDRHGRTLQNQYLGFSGSGVEMRAASAVDIALWDLFGQAVGKPLYECLGGLSHDKVRIYNTCAGYRYIRAEGGQKTGNWGVDAASAAGPYEDLDAFLNRADELAQSLLEQGITAMKIWPFDLAAEASEGRSISAAELDAALAPFRKIRAAVGGKMDIMAELHSLWTPSAAEVVLRALAEFQPFWAEDPIKMTNADLLAQAACPHQRADLRQRDARHPPCVPRVSNGGRCRCGDARPFLVRRHRRGEEDCDARRSMGSSGGAARLHRPRCADRLGASVAQLSQHADPGNRACIHQRLVSRSPHRVAGYQERFRLSHDRTRAWDQAAARALVGSRLRTPNDKGVADTRTVRSPAWR
jgi:L-alanine-DL-glutamate epimerase-like enolase superfamily enzyme